MDDIQLLEVPLPATLAVATAGSITLPENSELAGVSINLSTPTAGGTTTFDVLDGSGSLFAAALGTIRKGSTAQNPTGGFVLQTTDTTIEIDPSQVGIAPVKGQVLTIDSEDVLVTSEGGDYKTGSSGLPEYQVTVTRAVNGTTAATHTGGASIFPAKPKVTAGATASTGKYIGSPAALRNVPPISSGDTLNVTVLQVAATPGGGGNATLELLQR